MLSTRPSVSRPGPVGRRRQPTRTPRVPTGSTSPFVGEQKRSIEAQLDRRGITLRSPTLEDMSALFELQRQAFPSYRPEQLMNDQTLYRLIEFGDPVVCQDLAGHIVGYHLVFHLNDRARTAISCGLAVDGSLRGLNVGTLVYRHSALRSMAAGAHSLQGTAKTTSFSSLGLLLNKMGGVCDRFHPRLGTFRDFRFRHTCRLSARSLCRRPIDPNKLAEFAGGAERGVDYQQLDPIDFDGIEEIYSRTSMRVMAVAPPSVLADETRLFALPAETLEDVRADLLGGGGP